MLLQILSSSDYKTSVIMALLSLPCILIALTFHEVAHGYVAYKCGDPTARNLGRLTLNPVKHLDPIGFLCMLIFGFGWAKPVPINTRYFRNPKRGMALTAIAGPCMNLLLGFAGSVFWGLFYMLYALHPSNTVLFTLYLLFYIFTYLNYVLAVFNLIPIPPFDGSRILTAFLPTNIYLKYMRYERYVMYGILIALLVMDYVFNFSPFGWVGSQLSSLSLNLWTRFWYWLFRLLSIV